MNDTWSAPTAGEVVRHAPSVRPLAAVWGGVRRLMRRPVDTIVVVFAAEIVIAASLCTIVGWLVVVPLVCVGLIRWMVAADDEGDAIDALLVPPSAWARVVVGFWAWWLASTAIHLTGLALVVGVPIGLAIYAGPQPWVQSPEYVVPVAVVGIVGTFLVYMGLIPALRTPTQLVLVEVAQLASPRAAFRTGLRSWRHNWFGLAAANIALGPLEFLSTTAQRAPDILERQSDVFAGWDTDLALVGASLIAAQGCAVPVLCVTWAVAVEAWRQVADRADP